MSRSEIEATIRDIVQDKLSADPSQVEAHIDALDSLDRMQRAASIEDHFEILIHAKDEAELRSLDDLVHLIQRKLDGAPRA